jgi:threonine/homoserine/homoserine lactone efflux protein
MPIDAHSFQLYLAAAAILVLIPGPDSLLIVSRTLLEGRRAGWIASWALQEAMSSMPDWRRWVSRP